MQIAKHTGWTVDQIYEFDFSTINKMAIWAYNQEVVERENYFAVMQWHLGIQNKKSADTARKNLKKALKKENYSPKKDQTEAWNNLFRAYAPSAFDKFYNSLK